VINRDEIVLIRAGYGGSEEAEEEEQEIRCFGDFALGFPVQCD